jgi:hypothetical protein
MVCTGSGRARFLGRLGKQSQWLSLTGIINFKKGYNHSLNFVLFGSIISNLLNEENKNFYFKYSFFHPLDQWFPNFCVCEPKVANGM